MGHKRIVDRKAWLNKYLTGRKQVYNPSFNIGESNIETRANNTSFVDASTQVDNNLSRTVVIDDFEFLDVSVLLHYLKELHNNLGARSHQDLTLSTLLSVGNGAKAIGKYTHANHVSLSDKEMRGSEKES